MFSRGDVEVSHYTFPQAIKRIIFYLYSNKEGTVQRAETAKKAHITSIEILKMSSRECFHSLVDGVQFPNYPKTRPNNIENKFNAENR
jgi:hypothetical protein